MTDRDFEEYEEESDEKIRPKRKGGRILLVILLMLLLGGIGAALYLIIPSTVTVTGNRYADRNEIIERYLPGENDRRLLTVLFHEVIGYPKSGAFEKVSVRIEQGDVLAMEVEERPAYAYFEYGGTYAVLSENGALLGFSYQKPDDLILFSGLKPAELLMFEEQNEEISGSVSNLVRITLSADKNGLSYDQAGTDGSEGYFLNDGDVRIVLGSMDNMENKLMVLKDMKSSYAGLKGTLHLEGLIDPDDEDTVYFTVDTR